MKMVKALLMALGATLLAVCVQYYLNPDTPGWAVGILFAVLMNILPPVLYLIERMKVLKDGWEFMPINPDYSKTETKRYCNAPDGAVCDKICYKCFHSKLNKYRAPDIPGSSVPISSEPQEDTDRYEVKTDLSKVKTFSMDVYINPEMDNHIIRGVRRIIHKAHEEASELIDGTEALEGEPYTALAKKYEDVEYAPSSSLEFRKAARRAADLAESLRGMTLRYNQMKFYLKRLASGVALGMPGLINDIAVDELNLRMDYARDALEKVTLLEGIEGSADSVAEMGKTDIDCSKPLPYTENNILELLIEIRGQVSTLLSKHHQASDEFHIHTHLPSGLNGETIAAIHGIMQKAHDECEKLISAPALQSGKDDIVLNDAVEFFKCSVEECKVIGINHTYGYCALQSTKDAACSCSSYMDDDGHEKNIYIKDLKLIRKATDKSGTGDEVSGD